MTAKIQIKRTSTPDAPPTGLLPGELAIEMATPTRLWVGVPTSIDPAGRKSLSSSDTSGYTKSESDVTNAAQNADINNRVLRAGDTMTGNLAIDNSGTASLILDKGGSGYDSIIQSRTNGKERWSIELGGTQVESGGNSGSEFGIARHDDTGAVIDTPFYIIRSTGEVHLPNAVYMHPKAAQYTVINMGKVNGYGAHLQSYNGNFTRWVLSLGDASLETGGNVGSNFILARYNDAGINIDTPLTITRDGGNAYFSQNVTAQGIFQANGGYVLALFSNFPRFSAISTTTGLGSSIWHDNTSNIMGLGQCDSTGFPNSTHLGLSTSSMVLMGTRIAQKSGGGPWAASSDERIKNIIGDYSTGLNAIRALRPIRYTYKGNDTPAGTLPSKSEIPYPNSVHHQPAVEQTEYIGLVAQATETVMPEMVSKNAGMIDGVAVTDLRTLDTGPLIFALINAVKELTKRLESLESRSVRY